MKSIQLFFLFAALCCTARGAEPFSRPGTEETRDLERAQAEIDEVYKKVMSKLAPEKQKRLRDEERQWIIARDREAARIAREGGAEGGSAYRVDYLEALAKLVRARTAVLKGYLNNPSSFR